MEKYKNERARSLASGRPKFEWRREDEGIPQKGEDRLKVLHSQIKVGTGGAGVMRSVDSRLETEGG